MDWPAELAKGDLITGSWTVQNQGSGAGTGMFLTKFAAPTSAEAGVQIEGMAAGASFKCIFSGKHVLLSGYNPLFQLTHIDAATCKYRHLPWDEWKTQGFPFPWAQTATELPSPVADHARTCTNPNCGWEYTGAYPTRRPLMPNQDQSLTCNVYWVSPTGNQLQDSKSH